MRAWFLLLGGLVVWTIHFFALYAIGSIFLTTTLGRALTLLMTIACLAAAAGVGLIAWRAERDDAQARWIRVVSLWGVALSAIAIFWQGLVALLV